MAAAGRAGGLAVVDEVFADRRYMPDGQLAPRSRPDALITDAAESLRQTERIIRQGEVVCVDGSVLKLPGQSVCVHGDGKQALALARSVRDGLAAAAIRLVPLPEIV
jgi:UPF0271 protein